MYSYFYPSNNALHGLFIIKHQLEMTIAFIKPAFESLSLWQQSVVYWLDSALLLRAVILVRHSLLIYSSGERAFGSHPLGSEEWVRVKAK